MENDLVVTEIICIFALRIKTLSVMSKKHESNPTSQQRKAEACGEKEQTLDAFLEEL